MSTKRLVVLGSTGSIGTQVLRVVECHPELFDVVALTAGRNLDLLVQQVKQFRPDFVCVARAEDQQRIRDAFPDSEIELGCGPRGLVEAACRDADVVLGGLVGSVGLEPVVAALRCGTDVALANKEVLVMAGPLVLREAASAGACILPLDSEHAAVHQCLAGHPREALRRILLTASGGPFRAWPAERIAAATPEQALAHPNWRMGPKISVDSATLMNKGLEAIEARWLFDVEPERIDVVIHPESIVHSLVEYVDGSWLAQLSVPDMRIPISYVLGIPERLPLPDVPPLELATLGALHFEAPDTTRFPALRLASEAARLGGTAPAVLNAANEVAVEAFLAGRIPFPAIAETVEAVLAQAGFQPGGDIAEIREADLSARRRAESAIEVRYP